MEQHRKKFQERRDAVLLGCRPGEAFSQAAPDRYAQLCEQLGKAVVHEAERVTALARMDRHWTAYLQLIADMREGIQLTGNAGVGAATALYAGPLLALWGICNRFLRGLIRRP
jgi:hypothetical protein